MFDGLGSIFSERSLRDLLIEAVRYGEQPGTKERLNEVVDETILGGIVAQIGDTVIDGSVRRRLDQLREAL